jgi:DNA (cytosine-5)-methyltransferase 1
VDLDLMTRTKIDPNKLPPLITGPWKLQDLKDEKIGAPKHGLTVFSCFHCGGGSTMGYKLAGFKVLGGIEIDPEMMDLYRTNHNPENSFSFLMPIQDFPAIPDENLPKELFNLDVLDGSPPCSSFSMAGSREDAWNEKKAFREGQTEQVLDDLFFHFIKVADKLKPKIVIAENVKGLIQGKARGYVRDIFKAFDKAEYETQLFLLNSCRMGVPQARERTFFIARRKDLGLKKFELSFQEQIISVSKAIQGTTPNGKQLSDAFKKWWDRCMPGYSFSSAHPKGSYFNSFKLHPNKPANTTTATSGAVQAHWSEPRSMSASEIIRIQSFPDDYDFKNLDAKYVCGMSVPPLMSQRVAAAVAKVLLNKYTASTAL